MVFLIYTQSAPRARMTMTNRQRVARNKMISASQSRWGPEQDDQLRRLVQSGKTVRMIALRVKRTEMAVRSRLTKLKVSLCVSEGLKIGWCPPDSPQPKQGAARSTRAAFECRT